MNPFQHGEVFVTDDGAETDLDIGHYERFLDVDLVRQRQRHHRAGLLDGDRQGAARRVPRRHRPGDPAHHQRDQGAHARAWPARTRRTSSSPRSAARSATSSRCRSSRRPARSATTSAATTCFFLHVSLVPYLGPERRAEDQADPALGRRAAPGRHPARRPRAAAPTGEIPDAVKRKISLMCDVDDEAVVAAVDAPSIYDIPKVLHREGLDAYVVRRLGPAVPRRRLDPLGRAARAGAPARATRSRSRWSASTSTCPTPTSRSPRRCAPAGSTNDAKVQPPLGASDECADPEAARAGARRRRRRLVPGGFGVRGIEGKVGALRCAREHQIPTLGLCLGLQCMVIEFARTSPASRARTRPSSTPRRRAPGHRDDGGAEGHRRRRRRPRRHDAARRSTRPNLAEGSLVAAAYGATTVEERHRHRYEVNNAYRDELEEAGLVFSGTVAGPRAGRVHRAAARRAPVLRRHPGAPRAQVAPDPAAPAVRRADRGRPWTASASSRLPVEEPAVTKKAAAGKTAVKTR